MTASPGDHSGPDGRGRRPGSKRLIGFVAIVVLILVVIFGYMLLVGGSN